MYSFKTDMADVVDDYVVEGPAPQPDTEPVPDPNPKALTKAKAKAKAKAKSKPMEGDPRLPIIDDEELSRKRDILASVALLEGLEGYVGEAISASDVRRMKGKDLVILFKVYEEKSGQELLRDSLALAAEGIVRGLSIFLTFDDREALKADLLSNKQLGRMVARYASKVSEDYGDVVAFLRLGFDVAKHSVRDTPENQKASDHAVCP